MPTEEGAPMINKLLDAIINPVPPKFHGVMGIFYYVDDAADAVTALRQAGHKDLNVFSPVPHHEIEHALEQGPSLVRWVTVRGRRAGRSGRLRRCATTRSRRGRW